MKTCEACGSEVYDDSELAVDEAWMVSLGMTEQWYDNTFGIGQHDSSVGVAVDVNTGFVYVSAGGTTVIAAASAKTRRQFRAILTALGITTKQEGMG